MPWPFHHLAIFLESHTIDWSFLTRSFNILEILNNAKLDRQGFDLYHISYHIGLLLLFFHRYVFLFIPFIGYIGFSSSECSCRFGSIPKYFKFIEVCMSFIVTINIVYFFAIDKIIKFLFLNNNVQKMKHQMSIWTYQNKTNNKLGKDREPDVKMSKMKFDFNPWQFYLNLTLWFENLVVNFKLRHLGLIQNRLAHYTFNCSLYSQ